TSARPPRTAALATVNSPCPRTVRTSASTAKHRAASASTATSTPKASCDCSGMSPAREMSVATTSRAIAVPARAGMAGIRTIASTLTESATMMRPASAAAAPAVATKNSDALSSMVHCRSRAGCTERGAARAARRGRHPRVQDRCMSDYGHELEFGTFLTPVNRPAHQAVELAQLSERLGFELATFQDHPYQPAFHDTWTLMSFIGATTSRIRLAGNVHNLPLRQPAVLARSVASLDLLTGGRVALGIGAGGFWDAIEAMGARRLTPGEAVKALWEAVGVVRGIWGADGAGRVIPGVAVTALSEAVAVIRGIWDADGPGRLVAGGEFHRVDGAKRGPRPAHDVPVWIGAYQPRMLRLVGEKADGWLPSLGYLKAGDLASSNTRIDDAAEAAGRSPREVRRLLNVGPLRSEPLQHAEMLATLALEHGFSTFVTAGDDPRALEVFAAEVAPRVRELVAQE